MIPRAVFVIVLVLSLAASAEARDTRYELAVTGVTANSEYQPALGTDVSFYFAGQMTPTAEKTLGEYVANRKTDGFFKSDERACQWAFLSALLSLRQRALQEGGNAVINIVSFYKKVPYSSATDYECHAGVFIAGVALKGTVARIQK